MTRLVLLAALVLSRCLAAEPEPVLEISCGEKVDLASHLEPGKVTIFEFYSHYCPACALQTPKVEALANGFPDFVLRKIDINPPGVRGEDFGSPVARQYNINAIPAFVIYDDKGRFRTRGKPAYQQVLQWHWYFVEGHQADAAK